MDKIEKITRKWWFNVILIALFFLPSYSEKPINPQQIPSLIKEVLMNPLIFKFHFLFPFLKVISLLTVSGLLLFQGSFRKVFLIYFLLLFTFIAIFQNMAYTQSFGFAFITGNIALQMLIVSSLIFELVKKNTSFKSSRFTGLSVSLIILGFLAFWFPVDIKLAFSPKLAYFFNNNSTALFCMMWPFFLSVYYLFFPGINLVIFRIGGFIGLLYGIINVLNVFVPQMFWVALFHIPLLIISLVCFIQSFRIKTIQQ
jgi:hypothetical protein